MLLSPVGVLSILHEEAERAVARAAAEVGIPLCLSTAASTSMDDVAAELGERALVPVFRSKLPADPEDENRAHVQQWATVFPNPSLSCC